MASNLDLVDDADAFPYHNDEPSVYRFGVTGVPATLGYVLPPVYEALRGLSHWQINHQSRTVVLTGGDNANERSAIMKQTLLALREKEAFEILKKWRHEVFPVYGLNKEVVLNIERCASPLFGIVTYGVHAVAYTPPLTEGDQVKIWVPRRSYAKETYGGMLDSTAAGGIASGQTPLESIVRECEEEAALSPEFVRKHARAAGMVTNFYVRDERAGGETKLLQPECHYIYHLPLPPGVVCKKNDDEVEEFYLWPIDKIKQALKNGV
ncbi:hypothetical protein FQN54_005718 [Arachnomyces sp. PD_36]|nr:hypothetical protein FQN54_005718 [Arachnomyces sp. PD_36]